MKAAAIDFAQTLPYRRDTFEAAFGAALFLLNFEA